MVEVSGSSVARSQHGKLLKLAQLTKESNNYEEHIHCLRRDQRFIRQARREAAKQDLLAKVRDQQSEIGRLKDTLLQWQSWYEGSYYDDDDVRARLEWITPVIREKVAAANGGRTPNIPGNMRLRRNVAEHVFVKGMNVTKAGSQDLQKFQRAGRSKPFDAFTLLEGMAKEPSSIRCAGGTLLSCSAATVDEDVPDSNSILNLMIDKRSRSCIIVQKVLEECKDDTWRLQIDDIMYMDNRASPFRVYRIGYGDYEREVRVAALDENTADRRAGMWVRIDSLYKLEINDSLQVMEDVIDATEKKRLIKRGSVCTFRGWDNDGDALVKFGKVSTVLFCEDFCSKITLK